MLGSSIETTGVVGVGDGLAHGDVPEPGDGDDLARPGVLQVGAGQPDGPGDLGHLGQGQGAVAPGHPDPVAADLALPQPADGQAADVQVGVQVGDQELERVAGLIGRWRGGGHDRLQQGAEVAGQLVGPVAGPPGAGVGVQDGEADLVLVGVQVEEQLLDLVDDLGRAASERSTLLTQTTTGSRRWRALPST